MTLEVAKSGHSYETFITEAVDAGLSLLGESGKKAIYYYLEKDYDIKKSNMASKVPDFSNALDKTFGMGSKFLKVIIMKEFYGKMGVSAPEQLEGSKFVEVLASNPHEKGNII